MSSLLGPKPWFLYFHSNLSTGLSCAFVSLVFIQMNLNFVFLYSAPTLLPYVFYYLIHNHIHLFIYSYLRVEADFRFSVIFVYRRILSSLLNTILLTVQ